MEHRLLGRTGVSVSNLCLGTMMFGVARNSSMILVLWSLASPGAEFAMISFAVVLVVPAPPHAGLVAPEGRAVEPPVHAPQAV
jgi:hypothetical protein